MGTRAQRCDAVRNRDRLVEVAAEAFAAKGVEASLEDIARTAGVGIGTLYRHFPNRDALVDAVYRRNVDELIEGADELLATKPADEALAEFLQRFVEYVASKKGLATYLKSMVSADTELFTESKLRVHGTIGRLITAAEDAGTIRTGVDPDDVVHTLGGFCMMNDVTANPEQGKRVARLIMDGLRYGSPASSVQ
jgi:AcrR family transcriptional regulator